ncbi:hypothetical protein JHK82_042559 [Glycine max]|uniref:Uncharacterized protein n=1 Tax=Glycine max TaxID=3847 RepID=K7MBW4_SOYBN|nr:hypothetical protein JHK85_043220 [Glycine max]KAG5105589.1 hypothetical protein JHK82_042559 [Glycine max]KAH1147550.1 hypothetical protein GYH30_042615 [Glycine max]
MAYCALHHLSRCLPKIVPKLTEVLTDTHPKVQLAGQMALQHVGSVIKSPEISGLVPTLLKGLCHPKEHTKYSLNILLQLLFCFCTYTFIMRGPVSLTHGFNEVSCFLFSTNII